MASGLNLMTYFVTGMQPKSERTVDTSLSFHRFSNFFLPYCIIHFLIAFVYKTALLARAGKLGNRMCSEALHFRGTCTHYICQISVLYLTLDKTFVEVGNSSLSGQPKLFTTRVSGTLNKIKARVLVL